MEKITITRALAELKLLDARINKEIQNTQFVDVYQSRANKALKSQTTKEIFESGLKSSYQSINDLIERRKKIKGEILKSNSKVTVKISDKQYFVVEAIERKNSISYEKQLLEKMRFNFSSIKKEVENYKANLDNQIDNMLSQNLGSDKKASKEDYENIAKPFIEANELKMIDPLNIQDKITKLDKEIDGFLSEVDFVLSESNSRTEIEI